MASPLERVDRDRDEQITSHALRGFLLALATDYKIPFIFTKDSKETAMYLLLLSKKEKKEISLRQTRSSLSKKEQQQIILEGFPGLGPIASKKLIKEFNSLGKIFNSPLDQLEKLLGKKAKAFRELLE